MRLLCMLGVHEWKRVYIGPKSCEAREKCVHCGAPGKTVGPVHKWEWIERTPCVREQVCARCGATGQVEEREHTWEWVERSPCVREQICRRCGTVGKTEKKEHQWKRDYHLQVETIEGWPLHRYEIRETCQCGAVRSRPSLLSDFVGQNKIKSELVVLIAAAFQKNMPLPHTLFCGPHGMGKTTLATVAAREMGVNYRIISDVSIRAGDWASVLSNLREREVLIIEQIDQVTKSSLELLVSAMDTYILDLTVGIGPAARSIRLHLPSFTVIGTSSRPSRVNESLRSLMFVFNFEPYEETELAIIILSAAKRQGIEIVPEAAILLARYSDGNPSQGLNLLKKAHMYAIVRADGRITPDVVENASTLFELDDAPRAAARQPIPDDVKRFVWQRDGGRCVKCGSRENLEFDHIIPISKGGSNTARNIQLLCARCNRAKGANVA
jgi:Holliday junction DNA helicase RuvB